MIQVNEPCNICQENHFSPLSSFKMDQQMTAYNIASSGMGITFIGDMLLSRVPINPSLTFYQLPGKTCQRNVSFYWKKGRYLNNAMNVFLKMLCIPKNARFLYFLTGTPGSCDFL